MDRLRIGILGVGRIGERHAQYAQQMGHLAAVCDTNETRACQVAEKFQCAAFTNLEKFLNCDEEIDLVAVCTPNGYHAEHTIKSLRAGKHVLCEKPMALTVKDCESMINEAERANRRLFIVKQNRFNPPVVALKKAINEGRLGKILSVQLNCFWNRNNQYYRDSDWKGTRLLDGGTLFTQFSHFIDLLYWLFGDVKRISGIVRNLAHGDIIEFEDSGVGFLEFDSGAVGSFHYTVNSYAKNMEGSLTVFGEKGTVKVGGQYLNTLEYQSLEGETLQVEEDSRPANSYGYYQGSMSNHDKVYHNVIDVLMNGASISTNCLEGLKTVQIIEKFYQASAVEMDKARAITYP